MTYQTDLEKQIAEARRLLEKATPPPWTAWLREDYDPERFLTYRPHTVIGKDNLGYWSPISGYEKDREDAALIVAVVNFLPEALAALSELRSLRERAAEAKEERTVSMEAMGRIVNEEKSRADRAESEVVSLRERAEAAEQRVTELMFARQSHSELLSRLASYEKLIEAARKVGCVCVGGHLRRSPHKGVCSELRQALAALGDSKEEQAR